MKTKISDETINQSITVLRTANLNTLASRRNDLCQKFFPGITQPPLVFIIFFLPQEINLLFRALGLLQNSQKFTPAPSVTAHSLITHLITIEIKYKLTNPQYSYNT